MNKPTAMRNWGDVSSDQPEPRYDIEPVEEATIDDLDHAAIDRFLRRIRETRGPIFSKLDDVDCLRKLNVLTKVENQIVPTHAGLLTFGKYPQQFHPQVNITFVVFPNVEPGIPGPRGERFMDNRSLDGPIPLIISDCIRALKRNMRSQSIITGILRTEEWEYPEEVLREALVNALVHRDYSAYARGTQVQVELYPDRLEIKNPGGLYGSVEICNLGINAISSSRNSALLKILEDVPLDSNHLVCENRGSGIMRIKSVLAKTHMEAPIFVEAFEGFRVEIRNNIEPRIPDPVQQKEPIPVQQSVVNALSNGPLTRAQIVAATKLDSVQVRDALIRLRARSLVEMSGQPRSRNTVWRRFDLKNS